MTNAFSACLSVFSVEVIAKLSPRLFPNSLFHNHRLMANDTYDNSRPPRRDNGGNRRFGGPRSGGKSFNAPRKRFDANGESGDGERKPRRFPRSDGNAEGGFKPRCSFDERKRFDDENSEGGFKSRRSFGNRKRFEGDNAGEGGFKSGRSFGNRKRFDDDNAGEGGFKPRHSFGDRKRFDDDNAGEGGFKSRRFSDERRSFDRDDREGGFKSRRFSDERRSFDTRIVSKHFDNEGEGEEGNKPRRFADERKRFDRKGEGGFKSRRFFEDKESREVGKPEKAPLAAAEDNANNDVAESFATAPANEAEEKSGKEERPAPKPPLPFPQHRKVAVFGGSFDPIHNGHLMMAEYILARGLADEILFIPSAIPPHKAGMTVATPEQRLEMVRLATASNERFSFSDMELRREGKSYSFDTMSLLQRLYPDYKLLFIIGMDSLAQLHTWYRATELVQRVDFIVYPRPNVQPPAYIDLCASFGNRNALRLLNAVLPLHDSVVTYEPSEVAGEPDKRIVTEYDLPSSQLSSTEIRKALEEGNMQFLQEALPEPVLNYINENNLYRQ